MSSPKDVCKLSNEELKEFLDSFDHALFDCDGVIYIAQKVFAGVKESMATLKSLGKQYKFVTNNTTSTAERISNLLNEQGVVTTTEDVINPSKALIDYFQRIKFDKKVFLIGMPNMRTQLEEGGIKIANKYDPDVVEPNMPAFLKSLVLEDDIGAVIACFDLNMTYNSLNKAYSYLTNPDIMFITTGYDKRCPVGKGRFLLGPSFFHDLLAEATGRKPVSFGKPLKGFQDFLKGHIQCDPKRTLFTGDSLEQDVGFAKKLGYKTMLVLSGNSSYEDMLNCPEEHKPDYYISHLAELDKIVKEKL